MERYKLTLKKKETWDDYMAFYFRKPKQLTYEDGQYGVFLHVDKDFEGKKMRAFSFAAPNDSGEFIIATKIISQPSNFKAIMKSLEPGDQMTVDGPMGNFTIQPNKAKIFIAGGIGITPIRAMLLGMKSYEDALLIYSEASENYPFEEDFTSLNDLHIELVSGVPRTKYVIEQAALNHLNKAVYYIAGSPSFVKGIRNQLQDLGVTNNNIRYDQFTGYE